MTINIIHAPDDLKELDQWVLWKKVISGEDYTKIPFSVTGRNASSTDPTTWASYEQVHETYSRGGYAGIGFVFTEHDEFVGVDLDDCRDEYGTISQWARDIINLFQDTYAEVSPSGTGVKIFTKGKIEKSFKKNIGEGGAIEVYAAGRYFAVTGIQLEGHPNEIWECQKALDRICIFDRHKLPSVGTKWAKIPIKKLAAGEGRNNQAYALANYYAYVTRCNERRTYDLLKFSSAWFCDPELPDHELKTCASSACKRSKRELLAFVDTLQQDAVKDFAPVVELATGDTAVMIKNLGDVHSKVEEVVKRILKHQHEDPRIFSFGGILSQVVKTINGAAMAKSCSDFDVLDIMSRATKFTKDGIEDCEAPEKLAKYINNTQVHISEFPGLAMICEAPIFSLETGRVNANLGYDPVTKGYYQPRGESKIGEIPDRPTAQQAKDAGRYIIDELLYDFPFVDDEGCDGASIANSMAMILTSVLRASINGPTPMFVVDAPEKGTGKSLLSNMAAIIATGGEVELNYIPNSEEELGKNLDSVLMNKPGSVVIFDNVAGTVRSPKLSQVLTSNSLDVRVLGHSKVCSVLNRCTWIANGNNVSIGGDNIRRCVHIRMDRKTENPFETQSFKKSNLTQWATLNRGDILARIYTMARYWVQNGKKNTPGLRVGSYESWSHVIGGILHDSGIHGLMSNRQAFKEQADHDNESLVSFMQSIYDTYGDTHEFSSSDLYSVVLRNSKMQGLLPFNLKDGSAVRLGRYLATIRDKVRSGYRLSSRMAAGVSKYKVTYTSS